MWIVIYLAKDREAVFKLRGILEGNDILVMVREKADEGSLFYEVLVPQTEVNVSQKLIFENGNI